MVTKDELKRRVRLARYRRRGAAVFERLVLDGT